MLSTPEARLNKAVLLKHNVTFEACFCKSTNRTYMRHSALIPSFHTMNRISFNIPESCLKLVFADLFNCVSSVDDWLAVSIVVSMNGDLGSQQKVTIHKRNVLWSIL